MEHIGHNLTIPGINEELVEIILEFLDVLKF